MDSVLLANRIIFLSFGTKTWHKIALYKELTKGRKDLLPWISFPDIYARCNDTVLEQALLEDDYFALCMNSDPLIDSRDTVGAYSSR